MSFDPNYIIIEFVCSQHVIICHVIMSYFMLCHYFTPCQSFQNAQTLGQFFDPLYNPGDNPSTFKPQLVIKAEVDNHIAPILKEVGDLHSPPKSKPLPGSSLSGPNNFIEKNQRVFVYEDGSWCLKGRYDKAMKINDTLAWSNNKGYYSLIMGFVELFLK